MSGFEDLFGSISPLLLAGLIAATVELFKKFGLKGNWCIAASLVLGIVLAELFMLMDLYGDVMALPFKMAIYGVLFGLFVSGLYALVKKDKPE